MPKSVTFQLTTLELYKLELGTAQLSHCD